MTSNQRMVTISDLHTWIDGVAPDCTVRKTLHLVLERLRQYEVAQGPGPAVETSAPSVDTLMVDPKRHGTNHEVTGIYVRAKHEGRWGSFDIAELDRDSLFRFLRSRRGVNLWAENVVLILLDHEAFAAEPRTER